MSGLMSKNSPDPRGKVRIGHSLNEGEKQHVKSRRVTVQQCLKKNGITCSLDEVPNIALIGSGGGERAMVGLLGSLCQLGKEGLLDCMLYLGGVSGSTWCMASLYKEPNWSSKLEAVTDAIVKRLGHDSVTWTEMGAKLEKYYKHTDNYSLTYFWSAMMVPNIVKEIDEHVLSAQRGLHSMDPYPIYTVIDKWSKLQRKQSKDPWFELTPNLAGYSLTGAFVDSASFGSQFDNGSLKKEQPEMDMLYLQGMCGSALADEVEIWKTIQKLAKGKRIRFTHHLGSSQGIEVLLTLVELNIRALEDEDYSDLAQKMNKLLKGKLSMSGQVVFLDINGQKTLQKTIQMDKLKIYTLNVCESWFDWFKHYASEVLWWLGMIASTMKCLSQWKWGTTYNFLSNMRAEEVDASILASETRDYEDAGLLLNSPYFSVLRPERNIDLIISLDYSDGDPMETVIEAHKKSKGMGIAFPHVEMPEDASSRPKDFYVFPGYSKSPTVIHMPLFNIVNCGDDVEKWKKKYSTFQRHAYNPKMISDLMEKAALNVTNNKEKLQEEIKKVIKDRTSKSTAS